MMNYYDSLIQHHSRIADAERQYEQQRHLRDMKRTQEQQTEEQDERPSRLSKFVLKARAAVDSLNRLSDSRGTCLEEAPIAKIKHV